MLTNLVISVPGDAGRNLIRRYFEAEHSATAIIHPKIEVTPPTPDKRNRRSISQSASNSGRRVPQRFVPHPTAPAQSLRPADRSTYGQGVPAYQPYTGWGPLNNRTPPAAFSYGTVMNNMVVSSNSQTYRQDSFPFRY